MDINTHNVEAVETEAYNSYLLVVFQKLYRCCTHKCSHSDCGCLKVLCCIKHVALLRLHFFNSKMDLTIFRLVVIIK